MLLVQSGYDMEVGANQPQDDVPPIPPNHQARPTRPPGGPSAGPPGPAQAFVNHLSMGSSKPVKAKLPSYQKFSTLAPPLVTTIKLLAPELLNPKP